jgi:hypothetical protein
VLGISSHNDCFGYYSAPSGVSHITHVVVRSTQEIMIFKHSFFFFLYTFILFYLKKIFLILLFTCAYIIWVVSPPCPPPPCSPPFHPQFQAGPVLPLSLVLLKKRDKPSKEDKAFLLLELRITIQKYS